MVTILRPAVLAGVLAFGAALSAESPARAQFPIFYGGQVLNPDGRKIGTPPGRPPRPSDYPQGTIGYSIQKSNPRYSYAQPRYAAPRSRPYAPQPRYYAPRAGTYYDQQPAPARRYYR